MKNLALGLFIFTFSICSFASQNPDCNVGVRMIDYFDGEFGPDAFRIVKKDLTSKGYNVYETTWSDTETDLFFDIKSDSMSRGRFHPYSLGFTFEAKFLSEKTGTTYAHSYREKKSAIPYVTKVSFSKREELFIKVAQDVLEKIPACDQL